MITGYCHTNNDEDKHLAWPYKFVAAPLVGDRVQSLNGKGSRKVYSVEHCMNREEKPYLNIELTR